MTTTTDAKPTILIVDDCQDTLVLLKYMFESVSANVFTATSGVDALALLAQNEKNQNQRPFNLVILDIRMPGMQGPELASRIRELSFKGKIVGLTAAASGRGREASLKSGIDIYLAKDSLKKDVAQSLVLEAEHHQAQSGRE